MSHAGKHLQRVPVKCLPFSHSLEFARDVFLYYDLSGRVVFTISEYATDILQHYYNKPTTMYLCQTVNSFIA